MTSASDQIRAALISQGGGFLANPVLEARVTCAICAGPVSSFVHCMKCNAAIGADGAADLIGSTTYAKPEHQTGYMMYGYKAAAPQEQHQQVVRLILADALMSHRACAETLVGAPITGWTTVPSLTKRREAHPLRDMARPFMAGTAEISVSASDSPRTPRSITPENFRVASQVAGGHVMVVDDTWTTGSQAQSVAVQLRRAGSDYVTIYTVARWLDPNWGPTQTFLAARRAMRPRPRFDASMCPFTHGDCP